MSEVLQQLSETIRAAKSAERRLRIRGGGTKDFYGGPLQGELLDVGSYAGIVDYEPTELVVTARAGTPLADIAATLAERGQMLAFEPPHFGSGATLGGCVAAGLSGPRRAYAGAVRDLVLGVKLLNGEGAELNFGGRVMKNVAGFDVARLIAGSLGTLGVIAEVSLKTLPLPPCERTLRLEVREPEALEKMNRWAGQPLPVSATAHLDDTLWVRLSGATPAVASAQKKLGGETVDDAQAAAHWESIREHTHPFFTGDAALWRLSVPSTTSALRVDGPAMIEWGGAQRWVRSSSAAVVREAAMRAGGHATLFRHGDKSVGVFQPLAPGLMAIHRRLKEAMDPAGIFNRGRLYADF